MNLELQELAIVVTAKNYDPNLLSYSFLKHSGIVAEEWELAREPITNNRASQILFNNGIYLTAQPNRFTFVEALNNKEESEAKIPQLMNRYVEILRNLESVAVGVNFRGYASYNDTSVESTDYLKERFIQPGEWLNCGTEPVKAGLNLSYTYDSKKLHLSVNEAKLKVSPKEQLPVILFSGNFEYSLAELALEERLELLQSTIKNWQGDLAIYRDVIGKMIKSSKELGSNKPIEAVAASHI